jgi:hypothetical protein
MASQIKNHFRELCYGIPIALIAEWCCVSTSVASKYKSGARIPSAATRELFKLKLEGALCQMNGAASAFGADRFSAQTARRLLTGTFVPMS